MPQARIDVGLSSRGASLRTFGRKLRDMDDRQVTGLFRKAMEDAVRPYPARVRASVLAIPVKENGKHTGLRARIAACVETAIKEDGRTVSVAVQVNPFRMNPGPGTLPLYMEGVKESSRNHNYSRWRHPVYGRWLPGQGNQASHPYFYQAAGGFSRAGVDAVKAAVDDIGRKINE